LQIQFSSFAVELGALLTGMYQGKIHGSQ